MCNQSFHFSNEFIGKLKAIVNGGKLPDNEMTQVRLSVNSRQRIQPPVPLEYYGELLLWAYPKLTLVEPPVPPETFLTPGLSVEGLMMLVPSWGKAVALSYISVL
ncbi:unnamed protein product [Spirodela intermedia]|uniref:Uncharacterized protein n=1 Tax=Spirodela intermedia TaxID=51605 RepID=A0ABN7EA70_SPIIN|nr:unnamed protein product [Spirodela intermedia]